MGFDPTTGEPPKNFDPVTGKPVPRFDSTTGKPLRPREAAFDHTPRLMVYAPYARRVVAWLVDAVLVMAPLTAILYFAVGPDPQTGQAPSEVKFVIVPLLPLYSAILHAVWHGQTVGKRLLGIAVREVNGAELGLGRSFVRSYFRIVLVLFPLAWMVDALSPLWDRRNRSFHDHVAGTIVVRPIRPPAPQAQSLMRA